MVRFAGAGSSNGIVASSGIVRCRLRLFRGGGGSRCSSSSVERLNGISLMRLPRAVLSARVSKRFLVRAALLSGVSLCRGVDPLCEAMLYNSDLYDRCAL